MSESTEWTGDVRPGWLLTVQPYSDGWFYAVRNRDGKVVEGKSRGALLTAMVVEDVVRSWREAGIV